MLNFTVDKMGQLKLHNQYYKHKNFLYLKMNKNTMSYYKLYSIS